MTASVNRVDFLKPVEVGELITLKASINYTGRTSMVVGVRVESENVTTGKKTHCNSSYFTMVAKDDQGKSVEVPGLLVQDEQGVRRFTRSKFRKESTFERDTKFEAINFDYQKHLRLLEKENIKIDIK